MKDTARVLGRMYDGIQYRVYGQALVETLAEHAGVPVWNGLTTEFHPTQLLADLLTMQEHLPGKPLNEMTLVYVGDARNNMGNSMLEAAAQVGLDLRMVAPQSCWPEADLVAQCRQVAEQTGGKITLTADIAEGVKGADSSIPTSGFPWVKPKQCGRTYCPAARLSGQPRDARADRQSAGEIPALLTGLP